ncbi:glycine C-acetyltransferase [Parasphingopyxis lamellibrachiae]|uniref:2-amino-3-ketobutyrate coenzyme A ligase n=1 Tax=Parasphingopyxis lamellibrachiae TaxID=680125 RepID=A0A3D9FDJ0_9SPHN|nr:glycine C-acetyltransferase [Parasphingopyxis lamellibrachiae]RED15895.1 2-amino-3-ketobutyrate coenzyme A ligase [Parasphingopyxis lamellibrachiae]
MSAGFYGRVDDTLREIEAQGLTKPERILCSPQNAEIEVVDGDRQRSVLNFCANNYLGLADDPELIQAATRAMATHGFGMASVRFICGTQDMHRELEQRIARFFGYDDAVTFAACFDANGAVFEPLLGAEDAIISDSLNHASIIDGVRLCKAKRYRFTNNDMADLRAQLEQAHADGSKTILIVTDGVFSMDGTIADLPGLCDLADEYDALTMVDDCHASGFLGEHGRGTAEYRGVEGRIDILTGTLGKALGGGMGGFICARQNVIDLLKQRARPYLFSNALAPPLVAASIKVFDLVEQGDGLRARVKRNSQRFRAGMEAAGFTLLPGEHPIIPVMLGDAQLAQDMAARLLDEGIYVIGFSFPVVAKGQARIRTQMSAAHSDEQIDLAIAAFTKIGAELGIVPGEAAS